MVSAVQVTSAVLRELHFAIQRNLFINKNRSTSVQLVQKHCLTDGCPDHAAHQLMADAHKNIKKSVAAHGRSDGDTLRRDLGKRREIVPAQDKEKTKPQRTAFLESQELMTDAIEVSQLADLSCFLLIIVDAGNAC